MEIKNLAAGIVVLVVGLVLSVTVLVPVVAESQDTLKTQTFSNEADAAYLVNTVDAGWTLAWEYTSPQVFTINGVAIDVSEEFPASGTYPYSIISVEKDTWRLGYSDSRQWYWEIVTHDNTGTRTSLVLSSKESQSNGAGSLTVTVGEGTINTVAVVSASTTYDWTATIEGEVYAFAPDGSAAMKVTTQNAYVKGDSEFYAVGTTNTGSWYNTYYIHGTIAEGIMVEAFNTTYDVTISNIKINATEVDGYEGLYQVSSITFVVSYNNGTDDKTVNCTYNRFVVPTEVQAIGTDDTALSGIVSIIPLLVIVGLILGAIGMFISRRD